MVDGPTPNTIHQAANPPSGYSSTWGVALVSSSSSFIPDSQSTRISNATTSEDPGCFFDSESFVSIVFSVGIEIDLNGDVETASVGWEVRKCSASLLDIYRRYSRGWPAPYRGHTGQALNVLNV